MRCWLNGDVLPVEQARVPVLDRGFLYGDSLFETLRILGGRPVLLDQHLQRLLNGAKALEFALPVRPDVLRQAALRLPRAEDLNEGVLRIALSRGQGLRGPLPTRIHSPTLLMTLGALPSNLADRLQSGMSVVTSSWRKPSPDMLPNDAKLGSFLNSILAMQSVAALGADEALLLAASGEVAECSSSNIFLVRDGQLVTPWLSSGALAGITRAFVLRLALELGLKVSERRVAPTEFAATQEIFLTNAVSGVVPVARLDDLRFPVAGPVTVRLRAAYEAAIATVNHDEPAP
jgi:branched-chain amino acid aminotransferase